MAEANILALINTVIYGSICITHNWVICIELV